MDARNFITALRGKIEKQIRASKNHSDDQRWLESGSGGPLIYAMCFVGLIMTVSLFLFVEYRAKIYLLKDDMETNLHVVENYCITVNQKTGTSDTFERERERAHIITVGVNESSTEEERKSQANAIGKAFEKQFKSCFDLDGNIPQSGYIVSMSRSAEANSRSTLNIKEVRIFEPKYSIGEVIPVYCDEGDLHEAHTDSCKVKNGKTQPTAFWIKQNTDGWYIYTLHFDENNKYTGCNVSSLQTSAPTLYTGVAAEGATIESKISASFYPPNGFWNITRDKVYVEVCEAIDIVYANSDSRKDNTK